MLDSLIAHPEKLVCSSKKFMEYFGFIINSENMTISLPDEKKVLMKF